MSINTKHIYTVATINGFTHKEVKDYIEAKWGLLTTKDLTVPQYQNLINYLDQTSQGETEMAKGKTLVKGMFGNAPRANAPDFVVGSISVKSADFVAFLNEHTNEAGYVNLDIARQKKDASKWSISLNDYVKPKEETKEAF